MYYIEYSGSETTTDLANKTKDLIEHHLNLDVELVVGEPTTPMDGITILNENFKDVITLTAVPTLEQLSRLYL